MLPDVKPTSRAQIELVTVYAVSKTLSASLDIARTFREAMNVVITHMGFQRGMVVLDDPGGGLKCVSSVGLSAEEREAARYQPGEGVIGRVYSTGIAIVVPDIADEPLFLSRTIKAESGEQRMGFVAVPIKSDGRSLGVLAIARPSGSAGGFSDDLPLLAMVACLMSHALVISRTVSVERDQWLHDTRLAKREPKGRFRVENVVGNSRRMQEVFAEVHQAAPSRSTVLLRGESGTGKEAIARALHELSLRSAAPFVKVNCAALSESLLESELFGHEKGAFTGAAGERKGRFELAHGGTLFLDEIGDISASFQAKLLRVLQEREFERVGGSRSIKVDVRLVCATNRNLEKMVAAGTFRADLYYRINVVSIFLPPLRERREDVPALADHFLGRFNRENGRDLKFSSEAMRVLCNCYWPGNVRELENCVERTATMSQGSVIEGLNFPCRNDRCLTQMLHGVEKDDAVAASRVPVTEVVIAPPSSSVHKAPLPAAAPGAPTPRAGVDADEKPQGERERLIWAMERSGWVQAKAARLLNITPRQMGYALQKYQIEIRKF